jgi:alanine racemase
MLDVPQLRLAGICSHGHVHGANNEYVNWHLGVIPIGSADGLSWLHEGTVLVRGQRAPILGKPSLESCRVDLTEIPDASIGDDVVIIGCQANEEITLAEIAERHKIAMNLVSATIGPRVARVYT